MKKYAILYNEYVYFLSLKKILMQILLYFYECNNQNAQLLFLNYCYCYFYTSVCFSHPQSPLTWR